MAGNSGDQKKVIIALIILSAAIIILYATRGSWSPWGYNPAVSRDLTVVAIDPEEGVAYYPVTKKKDEDYPLTNPKTGQKTLWAAYVCHDHPGGPVIFPAQPGVAIMSCPICRSPNVGGAEEKHKDLPVEIPR